MSCCKTDDLKYTDINTVSNTLLPNENSNGGQQHLVNYPATNFSGNMGSNQVPSSTLSSAFTGGSRKKRCRPLKIKNVDVLYKKHNMMSPQKDIRAVKRQLMALTKVTFPLREYKARSHKKSRKNKKAKKTKKAKRGKKSRKSRKMRGGSTVGYSTGGVDISPKMLALANPSPYTAYSTDRVD